MPIRWPRPARNLRHCYQEFDLGSLNIAKAGKYVLEIKPAAEYGHNLMFFQSLEMAPVGVLAIE